MSGRLIAALLPLLPLLPLLAACAAGERTSSRSEGDAPHPYLFVFAGDADAHGADSTHGTGDKDFLAVIDNDTTSERYAQVVATAPIGAKGTMPHHIEPTMPPDGRWLVANAYMSGTTYLFDLADPLRPAVAGTLDSVPGMRTPHSFVRLADGSVLATMQFGDGRAKGNPGGLARFAPDGKLSGARSAADPQLPGAAIRPYALAVAPGIDRVVTTSSPMSEERTADVVQLWRLSDLSLLRTIAIPASATDSLWRYPFEVHVLPDGRSALINTYYCGFFLLSGIDGDAPTIERVLALEQPKYLGCSVPLLIGHWWIMPVTAAREYVVLDLSDPRRPRRAGSLAADSAFQPHWMSREPGSDRIVVTSDVLPSSVRMMRFDSTTGQLRWDERFRERPDGPLGVRFDRASWPHGATGPALPHGAVFSRGAAPR